MAPLAAPAAAAVEAGCRPEPPAGGWLRAAREARGVTQKSLADRLGCKRQAWAQLEQSEARGAISLHTLRRAADALGYDLIYALVPRPGELAAEGAVGGDGPLAGASEAPEAAGEREGAGDDELPMALR